MTTRIGFSKSKKQLDGTSQADKFSDLFDQDWKTAKSTLREHDERTKTYDVLYSWDARSDNPEPDSRLSQTLVPQQTCKPIVLSGKAVITLENTAGFDAINVKAGDKPRGVVPLTQDQSDLNMHSDLSGSIPTLDNSDGKVALMRESKSFNNYTVRKPEVMLVEKPSYLENAGSQCDQILLNPTQRRNILEFEKKEREAKELIGSAKDSREKLRKQLSGIQYHRGALMVDSNGNMQSEIYGERARIHKAESEYKSQIQLERKSRLASKESSLHLNGNILQPDSLGPRVKTNAFYQSKGGDYHGLSFDETHNRLFCRMAACNSDHRTQRLRDLDLSGKQYSITQHTSVEHWPSRSMDRIHDNNRVMDHPSQATREGTRNLQGSVRPF